MVWLLVGVRGCVLRPMGHSLVTLLFLPVLVKDRSLHKMLGKSQTYYPEHILGYGRLKDLLLSCRRSDSFRTDCQGFILVEEVLAPYWVRDSGAGAWSPSLDGDLDTRDMRVMGWSCLCLGYKRGVCFQGTQLGTLIRESPGDPVRLVSCLAP